MTSLRKNLKLSRGIAEQVSSNFSGTAPDRNQTGTRCCGDYQFELTNEGRKKAAAKSEICRYAGPLPVSLRQYSALVQARRENWCLTSNSAAAA